MKFVAGLLGICVVWAAPGAAAQGTYTWGDVDCAQSRLVALPDTSCLATNVVNGGQGAGGQFRQWGLKGINPYISIALHEAMGTNAYIYTKQTGAEYLKAWDRLARESPDLRSPARHGNSDYYLFTSSSGESCVGFRRYGPTKSGWFAWILMGVKCVPKGATLTVAEATAFIDSVRVR